MARYLNLDKMIDDYKMNSTYYCYKLIIPINEIVFDEQEGLSNEEKGIYLIDQICFRLLMYYHSSGDFLDDNSNPVIRAADSAVLPANYIVDREEITLDMLL